jgi:hypothetical protein
MHSAVAFLCDSCVDVIASLQCGLSPECSHSHTSPRSLGCETSCTTKRVCHYSLTHTHIPRQMPPTTPHIPLIHLSSLACVYALHHLALTFITSVVSARCTLNQIAPYHIASAFFIPSIHSVVWLACLHLCECARPPSPAIMQRRMMRMTTYPCHSPSDLLRLHPPA